MIRSRLSGRYIKPPVQVPQKIIIVLVLAGLCHLGGLMIGWNLTDWFPKSTVNVEASEAVLTPEPTITTAPSSTPTPSPTMTPSPEPTKAPVVVESGDIKTFIKSVFKEEPEIAVAVFKAESGLRGDAVGYNCWFDKDTNEVVEEGNWKTHKSGACPIPMRHFAWSVDCGITQMNVAGQVCPEEYFNEEWNVTKAYEWKYLTRGKTFTAWSAFNAGKHIPLLEVN